MARMAAGVAERSRLKLQAGGREHTGNHDTLSKPQTHPSWHTFSNKATPLNLPPKVTNWGTKPSNSWAFWGPLIQKNHSFTSFVFTCIFVLFRWLSKHWLDISSFLWDFPCLPGVAMSMVCVCVLYLWVQTSLTCTVVPWGLAYLKIQRSLQSLSSFPSSSNSLLPACVGFFLPHS